MVVQSYIERKGVKLLFTNNSGIQYIIKGDTPDGFRECGLLTFIDNEWCFSTMLKGNGETYTFGPKELKLILKFIKKLNAE